MTHPLTFQQIQRKQLGGADPDPRSYCGCGAYAQAKCVCGMNFCGRCWWKHSHTSAQAIAPEGETP